jgi:hypothetical protein
MFECDSPTHYSLLVETNAKLSFQNALIWISNKLLKPCNSPHHSP